MQSRDIINAGLTVTYRAEEKILLLAGFKASNGSNFSARLTTVICDNSEEASTRSENQELTKKEVKSLSASSVSAETPKLHYFPNPFSEQLHISYYLPKSDQVQIVLQNVNGQIISSLASTSIKEEGFQLLVFDTSNIPSGLYIVTMKTGKNGILNKMVVKTDTN